MKSLESSGIHSRRSNQSIIQQSKQKPPKTVASPLRKRNLPKDICPNIFAQFLFAQSDICPTKICPKWKRNLPKKTSAQSMKFHWYIFRKWVFLNCFLESPDYCSPAYLLLSWKFTALYLILLTTDILGQIARGNFKLTENQTDDALPANASTPECCG